MNILFATMGTEIPTFHPTEEEFKDFSGYIKYLETTYKVHEIGLCKVVPPNGWVARRSYDDIKNNFNVQSPIEQVITGQKGVFQSMNVVRKDMPISKFKELCTKSQYKQPSERSDMEMERCFWKNITYQSPFYGADIPGSLFDEDQDLWNLNRLDTILNLLSEMKHQILGVNSAYLYFGMWKSSFAWHKEDMDLYSINYLHYGAPKSWYAVPPASQTKLESLARSYYADAFKHCPEFLRHKSTLISPYAMTKGLVPFGRAVQRAGEFIITFPGAYHSGFNHGFNCAEATNFASEMWVVIGMVAKACRCVSDSVRIDMRPFIRKFHPELALPVSSESSFNSSSEEEDGITGEKVKKPHSSRAKSRRGGISRRGRGRGGAVSCTINGGSGVSRKGNRKKNRLKVKGNGGRSHVDLGDPVAIMQRALFEKEIAVNKAEARKSWANDEEMDTKAHTGLSANGDTQSYADHHTNENTMQTDTNIQTQRDTDTSNQVYGKTGMSTDSVEEIVHGKSINRTESNCSWKFLQCAVCNGIGIPIAPVVAETEILLNDNVQTSGLKKVIDRNENKDMWEDVHMGERVNAGEPDGMNVARNGDVITGIDKCERLVTSASESMCVGESVRTCVESNNSKDEHHSNSTFMDADESSNVDTSPIAILRREKRERESIGKEQSPSPPPLPIVQSPSIKSSFNSAISHTYTNTLTQAHKYIASGALVDNTHETRYFPNKRMDMATHLHENIKQRAHLTIASPTMRSCLSPVKTEMNMNVNGDTDVHINVHVDMNDQMPTNSDTDCNDIRYSDKSRTYSNGRSNVSRCASEVNKENTCDVMYDVRPERFQVSAEHGSRSTGILVCMDCSVAVHTVCCSVTGPEELIDPAAWRCRRCLTVGLKSVTCPLCPNVGGLFMPCTYPTGWVHSSCAMWISECRMSKEKPKDMARSTPTPAVDQMALAHNTDTHLEFSRDTHPPINHTCAPTVDQMALVHNTNTHPQFNGDAHTHNNITASPAVDRMALVHSTDTHPEFSGERETHTDTTSIPAVKQMAVVPSTDRHSEVRADECEDKSDGVSVSLSVHVSETDTCERTADTAVPVSPSKKPTSVSDSTDILSSCATSLAHPQLPHDDSSCLSKATISRTCMSPSTTTVGEITPTATTSTQPQSASGALVIDESMEGTEYESDEEYDSDGVLLPPSGDRILPRGFLWDLSRIPTSRYRLKCRVCIKDDDETGEKRRISGACIQCFGGRCTTAIHVTCAQRNAEAAKCVVVDYASYPRWTSMSYYCQPRHMPIHKKRNETKPNLMEHPDNLKLNDRVYALFKDGYWYPGTVINTSQLVDLFITFDCEGQLVMPCRVNSSKVLQTNGVDGKKPCEETELNDRVLVMYRVRRKGVKRAKASPQYGTCVKVERSVLFHVRFDDTTTLYKLALADVVSTSTWENNRPKGAQLGVVEELDNAETWKTHDIPFTTAEIVGLSKKKRHNRV